MKPVQSEVKLTNEIEETFEDANQDNFDTPEATEILNETVHAKVNPLKCEYCDENFSLETDLNIHIKSVHEGEKKFKCKYCEEEFALETDLNLHVESVHDGRKLFKCNHCDDTFEVENELKNHIGSAHEKKKLFQCRVCEVSFSEEEDLNFHIASSHQGKNQSIVTLNPICKSRWNGTVCEIVDCPKAQPPLCENPNCLVRDQGLPRWKVTQCRKWHSRPKSKEYTKSKFMKPGQWPKSRGPQIAWPNKSYPKPSIPVWQNQRKYCPPPQDLWFKSSPVQTLFPSEQNEGFMGNEEAAWSTPQPRNSGPMWGNIQMNKKMKLAMELVQLMSLV